MFRHTPCSLLCSLERERKKKLIPLFYSFSLPTVLDYLHTWPMWNTKGKQVMLLTEIRFSKLLNADILKGLFS